MAKDKTTAAYEEMLALLSPEERENLAKLTGQDNQGGGTKTPVVKINFNRSDTAGKKVAKGNFVVGQKSGMVDGKPVTTEIGTDLGDTLNMVILKVGTQYSYFSNDPKKRCSSQIICERGEVPMGNNLKNVCNDKSCPRRKEGIDKAEKCPSQYIAYIRLPAGTKLPDGSDALIAMMYLKGTQYMPFKEYLDTELKGIPSIAVITTVTATEEGNAVPYWQMHFAKGAPVPVAVFKENFEMVSGINKSLIEYKSEQQKKLSAPQENKPVSERPAIPVGGGEDDLSW